MKMKIWFKKKASDSFSKVELDDLTEKQGDAIEKKYSDDMNNGVYAALFIELDR